MTTVSRIVVMLGLTSALSLSLSAVRQAAEWLGEAGWAADAVGDTLPFLFTTGVVLFLYRVLPSPRPRTREIWPGAVAAGLLISLVRGALELYFEHLADLGALYGSLGALMALLVFVYAVSLVLVPGWLGLAGALFGWVLLTLALLDAGHFWLPDKLTLPLLLLGLAIVNEPPLLHRLIGAAAGYAVLALIALAYRAARGREGLGGGDPKLLAAIGAWLGWQALPFVLLAASLAGLAWAGIADCW